MHSHKGLLWDHKDCSPPGSSVHGTLQVRILEWAAIPFSRGSCWPRDWTPVSCIAGKFFTIWAMGSPTYIFTNTHIYMYIYIPTYIYISLCMYVYIYVCVCIHTHFMSMIKPPKLHRHKSFDCTSVNCAWQVLYISFLKFC